MQNRITDIRMDVDHARRIRNLWMHSNGLFDELYESDAIQVEGCRPLINPEFMKFKRDKRKRVPIIVDIDEYLSIYKSHIELLHHLHDTIQREHFAQKRSYGYRELKKQIVWKRLLIGK